MSDMGLTPESLKKLHADEITKSETFTPLGVSRKAALDYLETAEGEKYFEHLRSAAPNASLETITDRAVGQIMSGRELPRMELNSDPLVKIVPEGSKVTPHSPFFAKQSAFDDALAAGHNLSDHFALPIQSEASRYAVYQIQPKAPTEVFINHVAPTSELGGQVTKVGGAEQVLVPHRGLYGDPTYLKSLDNSLAVERGTSAALRSDMARGLGTFAGIAATAYDGVSTEKQASHLRSQGNIVGAHSEVLHFGSRNLGMLGGAALGAEAGAALGIESGPGALLTGAAGGVIGAIGGEKLASAIDNYRIYNQKDHDGNSWHFDAKQPGQGWTRTITTNEIDPQGFPNLELGIPAYKTQTLTAPPALANELNYKASGVAVQMALAHPPKPQDPYSIPAGSGDAPSLRESNWNRDPQTHAWSRTVTTGYIEHGMVLSHAENATPQRAAQLTHESDAIVAHNIANSPHAIAARYQAAYEQFGWNKFGAPTEAVTTALREPDNKLRASDGHEYTRDKVGQWETPGFLYGTNEAKGNVRDELNATYQREHAPAVPAKMESAKPDDPRNPENPRHAQYEKVREQVAAAYGRHGMSLSPEQLERTTAGVMLDAQKRQLKDIKEVHLNPDPHTHQVGPNSHVLAFSGNPHDVTTRKSVTDATQARQKAPEQTYHQLGQLHQQQAHLQAQHVQVQHAHMNTHTPVMHGGPHMGGHGHGH